MSLKYSREIFFKLIFNSFFLKTSLSELVDKYLENFFFIEEFHERIEKNFLTSYAKEVDDKFENILKIFSRYLVNWNIERINTSEKSIIILSLYEFYYRKLDIPIIINEALNITEKYCEEKSKSFVHGVLSSIINSNEKID